MSEKAFLIVRMDVSVVPPAIVGATITSRSMVDLSHTRVGTEWLVEWFHVKGKTFEEAEAKLLRMVEGREMCPIGDIRFLWQFLEPGYEAHCRRYTLEKAIREAVKAMPSAEPIAPLPAWFTEQYGESAPKE